MMWRVSPAKLARNPLASLLAIMPTMTTSGRDTRSSRSPSAAAATRPPSALCPPSSQISQPCGACSSSAPDGQALHPRRPFGVDDAGLERGRSDPEPVLRAQRRNRKTGIVELMPAEQFWRRQVHQAALVLIDQPPALDIDVPPLACRMQRRAQPPGVLLDHGDRLSRLLGANHRHVGLDDPGLLSRDRRQRVAEKLGVIHADRRDHGRERRIDHVGGVETPAEADFQQQHIRRMLREQAECRRGFDFENGDRRARIGALAGFERGVEFVIADEKPPPAAEAKAFVDPHQ